MLGAVRKWWQGRYVEPINDPHSRLVFMMGHYERHWTARAARVLTDNLRQHWQFWIMAALTAAGVMVAALALL